MVLVQKPSLLAGWVFWFPAMSEISTTEKKNPEICEDNYDAKKKIKKRENTNFTANRGKVRTVNNLLWKQELNVKKKENFLLWTPMREQTNSVKTPG